MAPDGGLDAQLEHVQLHCLCQREAHLGERLRERESGVGA